MKVRVDWPIYTAYPDGSEVETVYEIECDLTPYDPGRTYGPPEKCYPPEGPDCEIVAIELQPLKDGVNGIDLDPILWPMLGFNDKEQEKILDKALEDASEAARDRAEAAAEDAADARRDSMEDR